MRKKPQYLKEIQGTFEPSKEVEGVELQEWQGDRMPQADGKWSGRVQELWNMRCRELRDAGYLAKAFLPALRTYCFSAHTKEQAERMLLEQGYVVEETGSQGNTYEVVNKWWTIWKESAKTMDTIGAKFGFTPLDAVKIPKVKKIENSEENLLN